MAQKALKERLLRTSARTVRMTVPAGRALTVIHTPPPDGTVSVQIVCGAKARVTWITLVRSKKDLQLTQRGSVGAKASLTWRTVAGGKGTLDCDLVSTVKGAGGTSAIAWVSRAAGTTKQSVSLTNLFSAPRGGGEILLRAVATDTAHVRCRGNILIGPKGTGTQTHLTQEALMLDATAKIDAVPALEIKTNDVKASHSATVSRITPETLFYFKSRGISAEEARRMVIEGFVGEFVAELPEDVRNGARAVLR